MRTMPESALPTPAPEPNGSSASNAANASAAPATPPAPAQAAAAPPPPRGVWQTAARMLAFDLDLLRRHRRLLAACVLMSVVPSLYALIYLSSLWDPAAHTTALPVGIVNEDTGARIQQRDVALGADVVRALLAQPAFGYRSFDQAEAARAAVRQGKLAFALIIPPEFSRLAVPGEAQGAGRIVIYTSEGNNYTAAGFARRFAPEVARQVNQALNTQRWAAVLHSSATASDGLGQLRIGVQQLVDGSGTLADGLRQSSQGAGKLAGGTQQLASGGRELHDALVTLDGGTAQLTQGMRHLSQGVREMQARVPPAADLKALRDGAAQVAIGQAELTKGLTSLQQGAGTLRDGAARLATESDKLPIGAARVREAATQLQGGAGQLHSGLGEATAASTRLAEGATQVDKGVATLTDGVGRMGEGLQRMSAGLPADSQLTQLASGAQAAANGSDNLQRGAAQAAQGNAQLADALTRLSQGSQQLRDGLLALQSRLPEAPPTLTGSAAGMAESVQPVIDVASPVANQGVAYAPNFVPLSLWIGATLTTFLFALVRLPRSLQGANRLGLVLGKLAVPGMLVLLQTGVILAMLFGVLGIHVSHLPRFALTLAMGALVFLATIFALVRVFGDAGKVVAMLLLILQMASAGATMPIELASQFFQTVHPWLPLTWVVRAMRVTMFDAFGGNWLQAAGMIVLAGAFALAIATTLGRWKLVDDTAYEPAMDID